MFEIKDGAKERKVAVTEDDGEEGRRVELLLCPLLR
jgi:hypothetical protein